jgi:hypothetical protein
VIAKLFKGIIGAAESRTVREVFGQEMEGGARAWAWEPLREPNKSGARSRQTTRSGWRKGVANVACGLSTGAPECTTLQTEQQPSSAAG